MVDHFCSRRDTIGDGASSSGDDGASRHRCRRTAAPRHGAGGGARGLRPSRPPAAAAPGGHPQALDLLRFNPWLKRLPEYLTSATPLGEKLDFLSRVALFWFSADGPYGFPEWGFAVDTADVARFLAMSLLLGAYVALVLDRRARGGPAGWRSGTSGAGGLVGGFAGVLGLSTGPCSVVGCGAPVLPVVGLVFAGLSSGTLALLSGVSRVLSLVVLVALTIAVAWLGWQAGASAGDSTRPPRGAIRE